jgi:hypothetical protein
MNGKPGSPRRQCLSPTLLLIAVLAGWTFPAGFTGQGGKPPAAAPHPHPPAPAFSQEPAPQNPDFPPDMVKKQKKELLKENFEKMKSDAGELVELAKSLQADLDKSNENVLSLKVVDRAEKIEKLAKKIKEIARGY